MEGNAEFINVYDFFVTPVSTSFKIIFKARKVFFSMDLVKVFGSN